jgi:hypothetical protein
MSRILRPAANPRIPLVSVLQAVPDQAASGQYENPEVPPLLRAPSPERNSQLGGAVLQAAHPPSWKRWLRRLAAPSNHGEMYP